MAECVKCGRTIETGQELCSAHSSPHDKYAGVRWNEELYRAEQTEGTAEVPASKNAKITKIGRVS